MTSKEECVKVVVRLRPLNKKEKQNKRNLIVDIHKDLHQVNIRHPQGGSKTKKFTFDSVFGIDSTQEEIYQDIGYPLIESVLKGFNGTIFAYGQTGCGKTFTMQGVEEPKELRGIIPRAFEHIFESIEAETDAEFLVRAAYCEIYNESVRDLLGKDSKKALALKQHPEKGVFVKDLTWTTVANVNEIDTLMRKGFANREVGETNMNAESSRSHSIFTIVIEVNEPDSEGNDHFRSGKLNLVDLAGSERANKTGASGSRLKEGCQINLSLSALGNVISSLVDGSKHIPYRDSKLTRLLEDSLGGNTKTVMCAALGPADYNFDESVSTLRYANRAKNIKNKPVINEDPKDALLRQYKEEIMKLKEMLQGGGAHQLTAIEASSVWKLNGGGEGRGLPATTVTANISAAVATGGVVSNLPSYAKHEREMQAIIEKAKETEREKQREVEAMAAKHREEMEALRHESEAKLRKKEIKVIEKVVDRVVEVEKVVEIEVVDKQQMREKKAIESYSKAVVEQRNNLGAKLEEAAEKSKSDAEALTRVTEKLRQLQRSVIGTAATTLGKNFSDTDGHIPTENDAATVLAKQRREHRKMQYKLRMEKKKKARVEAEKLKAIEEKKLMEEKLQSQEKKVGKEKAKIERLRRKYERRVEEMRDELHDQRAMMVVEKEHLLSQVRAQNRDIGLITQVLSIFLPSQEISKMWSHSRWDEDTEQWVVPRLKPRAHGRPLARLMPVESNPRYPIDTKRESSGYDGDVHGERRPNSSRGSRRHQHHRRPKSSAGSHRSGRGGSGDNSDDVGDDGYRHRSKRREGSENVDEKGERRRKKREKKKKKHRDRSGRREKSSSDRKDRETATTMTSDGTNPSASEPTPMF